MNPANTSAPQKGSSRPAGLFTWIAVFLVVVVIATIVILKVTKKTADAAGASPTSAAMVAELTQIPASVFNAVGIKSSTAPVATPTALKGQTLLTSTVGGKALPEVLYMGAEFCPYCAAQRWSTIIALSRFGTWSNLHNMTSSASDSYASTPTFTFYQAGYSSKYVAFASVEEFTNVPDPAAGFNGYPLQTPTKAEQAIITKYDTPTYVPGMSKQNEGAIPFMSFANQFLISGSTYTPQLLVGSTRDQIASGLSSPSSPITQAIIASANYQTATICHLTKQQPAAVCTSSGVRAAAKVLGL